MIGQSAQAPAAGLSLAGKKPRLRAAAAPFGEAAPPPNQQSAPLRGPRPEPELPAHSPQGKLPAPQAAPPPRCAGRAQTR